ncbi:S-layer homology domain-containing protein [Coleofasciculus sp. H7-2]|uniref:S-layer homology domain-containing protein n=1 Tax=Coleofasciculus sp. H7-2 TaxID=3351545 RepID=UPI003672A130
MNFHSQYNSVFSSTLLIFGLATAAITPYFVGIPDSAMAAAPANTSFPDTQNYWAQPFIQNLAERNIVTGYPDDTYRPEEPVARDEFAAILQKAFSQNLERQIASGSVYKDIPQGYWASSAIEDAYEMGFMKGYPGGEFRPNQPVTRVEVLVSLAQNLNLPTTTADNSKPVAASATPAPAQATPRRRAMRPFMFPLAMTTLMQPLMTTPARATVAANPQTASNTSQRPVSLAVSDYYQDAAQIPQYAVDDVAATTAAGIVVNYPDQRVLNPTRPATRGEVAALIHQALVSQGKVAPIADQAAAQYVVRER